MIDKVWFVVGTKWGVNSQQLPLEDIQLLNSNNNLDQGIS